MGEGFPCLEGPSGARIKGEQAQRFPCPLGRRSRPGPSPQRSPLGRVGPGDVGGRPGENREAGGRGSPEPEEPERSRGLCPAHSNSGSLLGSQVGSSTL